MTKSLLIFSKIYLLNLETSLYRQLTPFCFPSHKLPYIANPALRTLVFLSQSCASCGHCTLFKLLEVYMHGACHLLTVGGGAIFLRDHFQNLDWSWGVILINFVIVVQSSNKRELKLNITAIKVPKH